MGSKINPKYQTPGHNHMSRKLKEKLSAHDKQHNDTPCGRNFACWDKTAQDDEKYRDNMDSIFPNSPGAGI